eukprot:53997-Alexandrium_andersonii.AAC.1
MAVGVIEQQTEPIEPAPDSSLADARLAHPAPDVEAEERERERLALVPSTGDLPLSLRGPAWEARE